MAKRCTKCKAPTELHPGGNGALARHQGPCGGDCLGGFVASGRYCIGKGCELCAAMRSEPERPALSADLEMLHGKKGWFKLNDELRYATEARCTVLLQLAIHNLAQKDIIRRIHCRFNKVRGFREREELGFIRQKAARRLPIVLDPDITPEEAIRICGGLLRQKFSSRIQKTFRERVHACSSQEQRRSLLEDHFTVTWRKF